MTTTAGKWFEIDSKKGQVYLVGAATRELAFEYHDKGYIALEANLGFEDGKTISFSQGGNTVTATDDENGFSEDDIGKYIYTGDGWHKIISVSDVMIVGRGENLLNDAEIVPSNAANTTVTRDGHAVRIQGANATYRSGQVDVYLPAGTYTIKADIAVTSGVARITRRASTDGGKTYPSVTTDGAPSGADGYTFNVEPGAEWNRFSFYATWTVVENGDVTYSNIRLYTGTDAEGFEPYEDVPFISIDNTQGQLQTVALEAGCVAQQAGAGDPSPSNIRAISGRESVEVVACGKNLIDASLVSDEEKNGITVTRNPDGSIRLEGTSTANLFINLKIHGGTIFRNIESAVYVDAMNSPKTYGGYTAKDVCIEQRPTDPHTKVYLYIASGTNLDKTYYPQLELGSTATAYEPYTPMGGGVVTPSEPLYGLSDAEDTVEVDASGDVTVTRRTAVVELDGTESITYGNAGASTEVQQFNAYQLAVGGVGDINSPVICSHLPYSPNVSGGATLGIGLFPSSTHAVIVFGMPIAALTQYGYIIGEQETWVPAFRAYLAAQKAAGTPVTIVYELATPTTETPVDVDPIEPQIGEVNVFTDADSLNITLYKTENNKYASVTGSFM